MPGLDKTGPQGRGSKTGRGLGLCNATIEPLMRSGLRQGFFGLVRGLGRGFGRGRGSGRGFGRGWGFFDQPLVTPAETVAPSKEAVDAEVAAIDAEIEALRSEKAALKELRSKQTSPQKEE